MGKFKRVPHSISNDNAVSKTGKISKKVERSIGYTLENWLLSRLYKRNRDRYVKAFKISAKYESDSSAYQEGRAASSLHVNRNNYDVYRHPNRLTLNKSTYLVCTEKDDERSKWIQARELESIDNTLLDKTLRSLFSRYNKTLAPYKRTINFNDCQYLKQFVGCILTFRFECVHCSLMMSEFFEDQWILRIIFGKNYKGDDDSEVVLTLPLGLIHDVIRSDQVEQISFYDQRNLPDKEQEQVVNDEIIRIDDFYCFLDVKTDASPLYSASNNTAV